MRKYVSFDWALKRLLRNKANHVVLEGFLSELLREDIRIEKFLESEGNKDNATDKYNRVDIMCEDGQGRKIIIEVQYDRAYSYFHRMLYGTSKVVTEYMESGQDYKNVTKIYSINIVYFDLGQGTDYVYHGKTVFRGLHDDDTLQLSAKQQAMFDCKEPGDVMPEYYVLKVNGFNDVAKDTLDEWISFLKTGDIKDNFTAKGLPEARERLRVDSLPDNERRAFFRELERQMAENDVMDSKYIDGRDEGWKEGKKEGMKEGEVKGIRKVAINMKAKGMPVQVIVDMTGLAAEEIEQL